jgi:hypothetical protein
MKFNNTEKIQNIINTIENDFIQNQKDIFNMYNYYTKKYRGDRILDVNCGLFLNDNLQPVAQIFVRNKTGCIKTHLIFNKAGNKIIDKQILNLKV